MVLPRRPVRHRSTAASPPPVPGPVARPASSGAWSLAVRARQLRLRPEMVACDLADVGARPEPVRLRRVLLGVEPADPALTAALVEVLALRDRSLTDAQVLAATAGAWLSAGHRVPERVAVVLAEARGLSVQQVLNVAARSKARRTG